MNLWDRILQPIKDIREEITLPIKWETLHLHVPMWVKDVDFSKYQGGLLVDVGCHYGLVSIYFIHQTGGHAHGFDVNPRILALLRKNLTHSKYANQFTLHEYGLSDREGFFPLYRDTQYSGATTIDPAQVDVAKGMLGLDLRQKDTAHVKRLDEVKLLGKVSLIKIDCEGSENRVLLGALHTLQKDCPDVIFEALTEERKLECEKTLKGLGYTVKELDSRNYLAMRVIK
ncbi:MAG: FkbM family methyltransferase [Candidatus Diapherotrites archaeon]